jgi:hypothetical protein
MNQRPEWGWRRKKIILRKIQLRDSRKLSEVGGEGSKEGLTNGKTGEGLKVGDNPEGG